MSTQDRHHTRQRLLLRAQLPQRVARVCQRGERLQREGWDINTLQRLADDCALLAAACHDLGATGLSQDFEALHASSVALLQPPQRPDQATAAHIATLVARLAQRSAADTLVGNAHASEGPGHEQGLSPCAVASQELQLDATGAGHAAEATPVAAVAPAAAAYAEDAASAVAADAEAAAPALAASGLATLIQRALDGHGLELAFQPIMSLRGDDDEQFQALLRLRDADGHLHAAHELIPAATRAGLMGAVDRWVLEHCVERILQRGHAGRAPRLFFSQSIDSVRDAQAPTWLRALLARRQVAGDALTLELHIDDAAAAPAEMRRHTVAMKALGVHVALSGVEPGERDQGVLDALPIDFVKLAPRCLDGSADTSRDALRTLIDHLHERGMRVIAPRVEDACGAAALCRVGVDFIQGNFVQPADAELAFDFGEATLQDGRAGFGEA